MNLETKIGRRMKVIRALASIKQKDLAQHLDIPAALLSMYEKGKREPSINFINSFCTYFSISLAQFFLEFDEEKNEGSENVASQLNKIITLLERETLKNLKAPK